MYSPMDISRIDRQIEDLQRIKAGYQNNMAQPPINNIINTQQTQQPIFEAKYTNENPADVFIQNKTAFIDLKNGKLTIKSVDGEMKEYGIILPLDEKDLKIQALENKLREMELKLNNNLITTQEYIPNQISPNLIIEQNLGGALNEYDEHSKSNGTISEQQKSYSNGNESSSKQKSKGSFFKSSE